MAFKLVVVEPFDHFVNGVVVGQYHKGQTIHDQSEVRFLLAERDRHCVKVNMTAEEEAALKPAPKSDK